MNINKRIKKLFRFRNLVRIKILILFILLNSQVCISHAASQGKLGRYSSASIDISVQVNQTLSTVSPEELLVQQEPRASKPFCIAHHGYNLNARVPYELRVDELKMPQNFINSAQGKNISNPYNIYLEDNNSRNDRLRLTPGMALSKQSTLSFNDQLTKECENTGVHLSIETTQSFTDSDKELISPGLLILLVSPN